MKIIIHARNRKRHNCQVCGKEFVGTPRQKTCSPECQSMYKKTKNKKNNTKQKETNG